MTKSRDAGEDLVGRLGPHERLGASLVIAMYSRIAASSARDAAMGPALDLLLGSGARTSVRRG